MHKRRTGTCIALAGAYLALSLIISFARLGHVLPHLAVLLIAVSFISIAAVMLAQIGFTVSLSRLQMKPAATLLTGLAGALVLAAVILISTHLKSKAIPVVLGISLARDLCIMVLAASVGYGLSFIIREPNILLPVGLCAAIVDFWGVNWGPVNHVLTKAPKVVKAVSVAVPTPVPGLPSTTIGPGDFVFLALFFGVLYKFRMNVKGSFWLGYALLVLSMFAVLIFNVPVPALVPMGVAVIIMNLKEFKLSREEMLSTAIVAVFLSALLAAISIFIFKR
jgi:hypothetical protein